MVRGQLDPGARNPDLTVRCERDTRSYPEGIGVTEAETMTFDNESDTVHPAWTSVIALGGPA